MILHIDMDAFFAAVEQRDNPALRGKPVVISGTSKRSVVSTASYEARQFGIRSAMPLFQARQRYPHLVIVPGSRKKYAANSRKIMAVVARFTPLVEQVSIDEAYADITGCASLFGPPRDMALKIKQAIFDEVALTCSIGIAPVKFLAKIASDMDKPDGLTIIEREGMEEMLKTLPIGNVPGVGKRAMLAMDALNIQTLGDVKAFDQALLTRKFGKFGTRLFQLSRGIDTGRVEAGTVRKSISSETTLGTDISDFKAAKDILLDHSRQVGRDLRKKQMVCRNVSIKVKFSDFTQTTRSKKTRYPICASTAIFEEALSLFKTIRLKKKIRLLGVGVSHLAPKDTPFQMDLLEPESRDHEKQWESVDHAVDAVSEKFGSGIVMPAVLKKNGQKRR